MVSFYPEFDTDYFEQGETQTCFLVDCSNSMQDNNLVYLAKKLTFYMLQKLKVNSGLFNVILFGTDYVELFPVALQNTQANLGKAYEFLLNNMNSAKLRGNTDLLNVLRPYLLLNDSCNYNFVLVSDGHLSRPNELFQSLSQLHSNANSSGDEQSSVGFKRVFTCSVGNVANNNHMLKMIARLTNASYDTYDAKYQSKWKTKIVDLIDKISQPAAINNIRIEWQNMDVESNGSNEMFKS